MKTRITKLRLALAAGMALAMSGVAQAQGLPGGFGGFGGAGAGGAGGRGGGNNQGLRTAPVNASYDTRTNKVIVTGPTDVVKQIEDMVKAVDLDPAANNQIYTYNLRNGSAYNIEAVANLLFSGTGGGNRGFQNAGLGTRSLSGASTGGGGGARGGGAGGLGGGGGARGGGAGGLGGGGGGGARGGGGTTAQFGGVSTGSTNSATGLLGQVVIVADPNTNALLVTTNPKNWPDVKRILDDLDRSVPQVLIQVLIAQITHTNTLDLGADWSVLNTRAPFTVGTGSAAVNVTPGQIGGTNFNIPGANSTAQGIVVQLTESNFTAVLRALQSTSKVDVLSRPYILATDNQLAEITIGQTVPYIASSTVGTNGNIINTPGYSNVGILLDVIPHINPDGMVLLDVAPEVSSLVPGSGVQVSPGVESPIFDVTSAQSRVAVMSGNTVVIGGLMKDQKTQQIDKVPLLGDIPYVGELFKHRIEGKSKQEILIFMTPQVVARPELLPSLNQSFLGGASMAPNAVGPGVFDDHMKAMSDLGNALPPPSTRPVNSSDPASGRDTNNRGRGRGFGAGFGPGGGDGGGGGGAAPAGGGGGDGGGGMGGGAGGGGGGE